MKAIRIPVFVLAVLLAFSVCNAVHLTRRCALWQAELTEADRAAAMGDTEAAGAALARLEALWQADQAYLHIDTFRGNCRVESWRCQIAKNALTKELRRQRRAVPFEETHELAAPDDIFELLADKEQAMRIHASLHRLKEPYREVFTLRVLGELHFRDIADLFGKSESWAKVTFYRAKDKLIEDMEEHHEH